jgi:hypothetical protein
MKVRRVVDTLAGGSLSSQTLAPSESPGCLRGSRALQSLLTGLCAFGGHGPGSPGIVPPPLELIQSCAQRLFANYLLVFALEESEALHRIRGDFSDRCDGSEFDFLFGANPEGFVLLGSLGHFYVRCLGLTGPA